MLTIFPDFSRCACLYVVALSYSVISHRYQFFLPFFFECERLNHINAFDKNLPVNSHKLRVQTLLVTAPEVSPS